MILFQNVLHYSQEALQNRVWRDIFGHILQSQLETFKLPEVLVIFFGFADTNPVANGKELWNRLSVDIIFLRQILPKL